MNATISLISLDKKLLYDGLDEGFYQFVFNPPPPGSSPIAMDEVDENFFPKLIPIIGPQAFSELLQEGDFVKNSNQYAFKGTDKLGLRFLLRGGVLWVFAMGEFQPERYKIYLEGTWSITAV